MLLRSTVEYMSGPDNGGKPKERGAVAIHLCSQSENVGKIAGLMVENTFTSIPHVARSMLNVRLVQHFPNFCYKNMRCRVSEGGVGVLCSRRHQVNPNPREASEQVLKAE
ncbi:unnamed protein product [Cyprideis torosa]|uniref:Uncharacterized protein n=1 Tax=Cyprideis torosa TaxID=163714 RepID=A0A7R8WRP7_9CRUS|nr:unnamed protein product [Cyprideis torosa]CAG0904405.1 unnamed protein product [Cyprideis torosa]